MGPEPESSADVIDWVALRAEARRMTDLSHAPYSGLCVGAAGVTRDHQVVLGCNVESASFGVTLCAECGLVSDLHRQGGAELIALCVSDGDGTNLWPCGRCRQLLFEVAGPELLVDGAGGPVTLGNLLPHAFGSDQLQ